MIAPKEYNVVGSIIGLGPDTTLEILTEMMNRIDIWHFVGTNKKTF